MHQWYEEGLLDPDMFSSGEDQTNTKLASGKIGATIAWGRWHTSDCKYIGTGRESSAPIRQQQSGQLLTRVTHLTHGFRNTKFFDGGIAIGGTCERYL